MCQQTLVGRLPPALLLLLDPPALFGWRKSPGSVKAFAAINAVTADLCAARLPQRDYDCFGPERRATPLSGARKLGWWYPTTQVNFCLPWLLQVRRLLLRTFFSDHKTTVIIISYHSSEHSRSIPLSHPSYNPAPIDNDLLIPALL